MSLFLHRKRFLALWYFIQYQKSPMQNERAKIWLLDFFKKEKGLLLKLGQIWGTSAHLRELLIETDFSLSSEHISSVKNEISKDLKRPFEDVFEDLELLSDRASLSTVYLAKLKKTQKKVVIKKKREGIEKLLKDQFDFLRILGSLEKWSPLRKHSFNFKAYLDECQLMISQELNYLEEASFQESFSKNNSHRPQVRVPAIEKEFVFTNWFVQEYIEAHDFTEMLEHWPAQNRETLLYLFCQTFLDQFFIDGHVQGDSHLGNYLFELSPEHHERIVFLDFGAHLWLSERERKALLTLFDLVHHGQLSADKILHLLVALEFDQQKVTSIGPVLVSVIQQMLCFLSIDRAYSLGNTKNMRLEDLLQDNKWSLRSSGAPRFLQIMRAFYGLSSLLKKSQVSLNFYQIYRRFRADNPDILLNIHLPQLKLANMDKTMQAKNLKIIVKKNGSTTVDLSMPATSIYDLEDLLPASAVKALQELELDLTEIKNQAIRSGLTPKTLFEWESEDKSYHVLLV